MNELALKDDLRRWTLFLGVLQITVGCLVGMLPPDAVAWFRGIVMAHIEYTANGVLVVVFGLLVRDLNLGRRALWAWFVALQVGTWTNGTAGLVGGLLGASAPMLPTLNEKFPAPHGADNPLVAGLLLTCAVGMLAVLGLTLLGLARRPVAEPVSS